MNYVVTGASGWLGTWLCQKLERAGYGVIKVDRAGQEGSICGDLTNPEDCDSIFHEIKKSQLEIGGGFHLAGENGNIEGNRNNPWDLFYTNTQMGLNVIEACRAYRIPKVVCVVASCAYPDPRGPYHLYEDTFLKGEPHESVEGHGWAKRNLQLACRLAHKQYGLRAVCACPATLFGPGQREAPKMKVLNGLIHKFLQARKTGEPVRVWGTGKARRQFLYVEDCARLLIQVMEKYEDCSRPINLGLSEDIAVKDLLCRIAGLAQHGQYEFAGGDDGQIHKLMSVQTQNILLGNPPLVGLQEGIRKTIEWMEKNLVQ